jgi:ankyrin repeat protein
MIMKLIRKYPHHVRIKDNNHQYPLHLACSRFNTYCEESVIDELIRLYPEALQSMDNNNELPLHYACAKNTSFSNLNY